ncbi:MAG: hypothetical protein OEZ48_11625 [Candidatus Bathyarchaeota archaeon]|nr:hypothetical protein [Candidatus Bathyarchaeota archaeon]
MRTRIVHILFMTLLFTVCVQGSLAHTPLKPGPDNESLETAYAVSDPTKSWAIYADLHEGGEAQYYRLDLEEGDRLRAMLYVPISENSDFMPNLIVMGLGISSEDTVPAYVEVPDGAGTMLVTAQRSAQPSYEPFTPSSYYYLASMDQEISLTGTYYVAVYEESQGGRYGLAIGYREEFGIDEWILVPIDTIGIHQWEGQSLEFILAPILATFVIGLSVAIWKRTPMSRAAFYWTGISAGLLYVGSGVTILTQMILALSTSTPDFSALLTLIFVMLPILLGAAILRIVAKKRKSITKRSRLFLALLGLSGLFAWAGLIIGPILSVLTSILPVKLSES